MRCLRVVALVALAAPAAAATWIVDASGGGDFRTLAAAESAARSGDILIVRPGVYAPFRTSKGIAVFGQSGAVIRGPFGLNPLEVRNLPAGQGFTLFGVRLDSVPVNVRDCSGRVLFESVDMTNSYVTIERATEAWIKSCKIAPTSQVPLSVTNSSVSLTGSELVGPIFQAWFSFAALSATDSRLSLSRCKLCVCSRFQSTLLKSAIESRNSDLLVTGDGSGYVRSTKANGSAPAISGTGRLTLDPRVSLSAPPSAGIVVTRKAVPTLASTTAKLGTPLDLDVMGTPGDSYFFFVSLPFRPTTVGPFGDLWMSGPILIDQGVLDSRGRKAWRFTTTSNPIALGIPYSWQVLAGRGGSFTLSNPAVIVHNP